MKKDVWVKCKLYFKWLAVNHLNKSVTATFWREHDGKMGWFENGKWDKLRLKFQSSPGKTNNKTKPRTGRHDAPLSDVWGKTEFNNRKWSHSVKGNPKVGGGAVLACTEINHTDVVVFPAWTYTILRFSDKIRQNIQFCCVSPETQCQFKLYWFKFWNMFFHFFSSRLRNDLRHFTVNANTQQSCPKITERQREH